MQQTTTRVMIVDDHAIVRRGLRAMVKQEPDLEVVAEAADAAEALELLASELVGERAPHIILMDLQMPGMDGIEATARARAVCPTASVILVTISDEEALLLRAIRAGASAYVLKDEGPDMMLHSIRAVVNGAMTFSGDLLSRAIRDLTAPAEPGQAQSTPVQAESAPILTVRESEVLDLLAAGLRYQEIADRLCLALVTVKKHVLSLREKLGAADRAQVVIRGLALGLVAGHRIGSEVTHDPHA